MYSDVVKDHFSNPRNVGELQKPDCVAFAKNEVDGDQVQLDLKIDQGRITDVKMKVMGCVVAIAATSIFTELIKGKRIEEAAAITKEDLSEALGGVPESKIRCSFTCIDAFRKAVKI